MFVMSNSRKVIEEISNPKDFKEEGTWGQLDYVAKIAKDESYATEAQCPIQKIIDQREDQADLTVHGSSRNSNLFSTMYYWDIPRVLVVSMVPHALLTFNSFSSW